MPAFELDLSTQWAYVSYYPIVYWYERSIHGNNPNYNARTSFLRIYYTGDTGWNILLDSQACFDLNLSTSIRTSIKQACLWRTRCSDKTFDHYFGNMILITKEGNRGNSQSYDSYCTYDFD